MDQGFHPRIAATVVIEKPELQQIFHNLQGRGYTVLGPRYENGAVVIGELEATYDLAVGYVSQQGAGSYKVTDSDTADYFAALPATPSWRDFIHPPRAPLLEGRSNGDGWVFEPVESATPRYAFIGVRPCELQALQLYDRIFLTDGTHDDEYSRRRESLFVVAVNCTSANENCFCTSMNAGPQAESGFDLALTELPELFLVESGSEIGSEMLTGVKWRPATAWDMGRARELQERAEAQITRRFDTSGLPEILTNAIEEADWDTLAERCLSCGNCTLVCPTCFCSTVEDHSNLSARSVSRERRWDSCYSLESSHVAGGNVRPTTASRHRQWVLHKFALSEPQVGRPACVGCGRCITWCPVGIDITEEVCAIRAHAKS